MAGSFKQPPWPNAAQHRWPLLKPTACAPRAWISIIGFQYFRVCESTQGVVVTGTHNLQRFTTTPLRPPSPPTPPPLPPSTPPPLLQLLRCSFPFETRVNVVLDAYIQHTLTHKTHVVRT